MAAVDAKTFAIFDISFIIVLFQHTYLYMHVVKTPRFGVYVCVSVRFAMPR